MIRFDNHAFKGLDESLQQLHGLITTMGDGTRQLVALLKAALDSANEATFAQAKAIDKIVNDAEIEVDSAVAAIINKFNIAGEDLRFVLGAVKIAATLERAADKVKNCTKRLSRVHHPMDTTVRDELATAIGALAQMLPLATQQILEYAPEVSQTLLAHGATVQQAYRNILVRLHAHQSPADDETHLLLVAKNIEQTADLVVEMMKICHMIHFATKYDKHAQ